MAEAHYPSLASCPRLPHETTLSLIANCINTSTHPYSAVSLRELSMDVLLVDKSLPGELAAASWAPVRFFAKIQAAGHSEMPVVTAGDVLRLRRITVKSNIRNGATFVDLQPTNFSSLRLWTSREEQPPCMDLTVRVLGHPTPLQPSEEPLVPGVGHVLWRSTRGGRERQTMWRFSDQLMVMSAMLWIRHILKSTVMFPIGTGCNVSLRELFRRSCVVRLRDKIEGCRLMNDIPESVTWRTDAAVSRGQQNLYGDLVVKVVRVVALAHDETFTCLQLNDLFSALVSTDPLRRLVEEPQLSEDDDDVLRDILGCPATPDGQPCIPALSRLLPKEYICYWASRAGDRLPMYQEFSVAILVTDESVATSEVKTEDCFALVGFNASMLSYVQKPAHPITDASSLPRHHRYNSIIPGEWIRLRNVTLSPKVIQLDQIDRPVPIPCIEVYSSRGNNCSGRAGKGIYHLPPFSRDVVEHESRLQVSALRFQRVPADQHHAETAPGPHVSPVAPVASMVDIPVPNLQPVFPDTQGTEQRASHGASPLQESERALARFYRSPPTGQDSAQSIHASPRRRGGFLVIHNLESQSDSERFSLDTVPQPSTPEIGMPPTAPHASPRHTEDSSRIDIVNTSSQSVSPLKQEQSDSHVAPRARRSLSSRDSPGGPVYMPADMPVSGSDTYKAVLRKAIDNMRRKRPANAKELPSKRRRIESSGAWL